MSFTTDLAPRTDASIVGRKGIEFEAAVPASSPATVEGAGVVVGLGDEGVVGHGLGEIVATNSETGSGDGVGLGLGNGDGLG